MTKWMRLLGVVLVLACAGCDVAEFAGSEDDTGFPEVIDEQRGAYGGVALGFSDAAVRAAFGRPGEGDGFFPLDEESFRGPEFIPAVGGKPIVLRYQEAAFLIAPGGGVYSLVVTRLGAQTKAGVAVGDPLDHVRERYEGVRCGESVEGEPIFGEEHPTYPWCRVHVGRVDVFFGDDPIEAVTITLR